MPRPYSRKDKDGKQLPPRGTWARQRKDGTTAWYARYWDQFGKEHREYAGDNPTAALKLYRQRKHEIETGSFGQVHKGEPVVLCGQVLDHYLPILQAEHSSPRNDRTLHKFWMERLKDVPLAHVSRGMIAKWRAEALKQWEPAGVQRKVAWLRKVLSLCVDDEVLPHHPLANLRGIEIPDSTAWHFLTLREKMQLRKSCQKRRRGLWSLVYFAISTGLRQHEQFSLLWEHVDFEHLVLTIPSRRGKGPGSRKKRKARHVPMQPVEGLLRRLWARREALPKKDRSPWVFPRRTDSGLHIDGAAVYRRHFRPAADEAGLPELRWHDLRHTFVSDLLDQGEDLEVIRQVAGHTDIRTTLRYVHLRQGREAAALERSHARAKESGVWAEDDAEGWLPDHLPDPRKKRSLLKPDNQGNRRK